MAGPALARAARSVKRFYKAAAAVAAEGGCAVELDGKPVRTPARRALVVPTAGLAEAIAEEWNRQGETIDPRAMPLTGMANAALDRVAPDPGAFADRIARYGGSDLLCYRAEAPRRLVERQAELWDPILAWARRRYDVDLALACGVAPVAQPAAALERLRAAVRARTPFELAALSPLATISGSLLIALAVAERAIDAQAGWAAAALDEHWQQEQWGEDAEAAGSLEARRIEFLAACRFLASAAA